MVDDGDLTTNAGTAGIIGGLSNVASNYTIAQAVSNATALTINKAMLTATANTAARDYGDANPLLSGSITGFKNNQTVADFGGDVWSTTATLTTNAGTAGIIGGLSNVASNYTIAQAVSNATALTVAPATLLATANAASRDYGDPNPALGGLVTGFKNGQSETTFGGSIWTTLADSTTGVGSYLITGGLTNGSPNYIIMQAPTNATALRIDPRALIVTANDQIKTYGVNFVFAGTEFITSGLVNSDSVNTANLSSSGSAGTASVAGGPYGIVIGGAQGTGLNNYVISYVNGTIFVNRAPLTIVADDKSSCCECA